MAGPGGLIDLHTHGKGRYDTRGGRASDILGLAALHGRANVAAMLPAIYPAPLVEMRRNMEAVQEAVERGKRKGSASILGVHLEGPFLNPLRKGALEAGSFLSPTLRNLNRLISGFEDIVRVITIAPELGGALRVMERCAALGIRVNMGHSDATYREALDGKRAGATGVTHLFNAMRPFHHREPGLAGLGLLDDDLYVEVVADGVHLSQETLRLIFRTKPGDRVILVSDSVRGPMYVNGVLQGGRTGLLGACGFLEKIGIPSRTVLSAAKKNPARYLALN